MSSWLSLTISCLALGISGITAWLTFFRKGKLLMTQPTVVFFGPDKNEHDKVYLRTLLYSTAKKGQLLESMHITLHRSESKQNFNIWVYGDKGNLKRGSGLFVPQDGVTFDHHFLLPKDGASYKFLSGNYRVNIYAKIVGKKSYELMSLKLHITEEQGKQLTEPYTGIYFDWGPDQQEYYSHIDTKPEIEPKMEQFLEFMDKNVLDYKKLSTDIKKSNDA